MHFPTSPPSIISLREQAESDVEGETEDNINSWDDRAKDDGQERAAVLYDFSADGEDKPSVAEGDRLVVLERAGGRWKTRSDMKALFRLRMSSLRRGYVDQISTRDAAFSYVIHGVVAATTEQLRARKKNASVQRKPGK